MYLIRSVFFLFIFNLPFCVLSQSGSKIDDLSIVLKRINDKYEKEKDFDKSQYFFLNKNWDSTLVYSSRALDQVKDLELLDYCHYMRGYSFMMKKLFNEAKKEYGLVSQDFRFYYKITRNLGGIALEQDKYDEAISYFNELEKLSNDDDYDFVRSTVIHDLGLCYFHLSQFDEAEKYLLRSIRLQKNDTLLLIGSYMDVANLYYEQYKDDVAIPYFEKAYSLAKKTKDFELRKNATLNMAVVEENRKNLLKSLAYRKEYEIWKDSLNDQNKVWAIAEIEKKHALERKQKQIGLLESENKIKISQRNGFVVSSILLLLLLGAGIYFYAQKSKTNKIILLQKEELDKLNATKNKLFSIVSHDLRSSVSAFRNSNYKLLKGITNRDYETLVPIVHKNASIATSTYNLLENLLHWATLQTHQLYFNMESIDLFSVVRQVEYDYMPLFENKKIHFENKIVKSIFVLVDMDSLKIIIRNLFDNAIKFSNEKDTVSVYTYSLNDDFQCLVIEDTGMGMNEETRKGLLREDAVLNKKKNQKGIGTGLGIQLCKSMIGKNKGKLTIESIEGLGTKMIITLQKNISNG